MSFSPEAIRRGLTALTVVAACVGTAWVAIAPGLGGKGPGALIWPDSGTPLPGRGGDLTGTLWTFDSVARMIEGKAGPVRHDLFVPFGWDEGANQGFAWLDAVLAYPLVRGMGIPAFYPLYLLLMLAADQAAAYLLFRTARAPPPVALGLSMLGVLNPFVLHEVYAGRSTQAHLVFHCLFLAAVVRLCLGARPVRSGMAGGLALAASCFVYWFSGVAVGVLGALALLGHAALGPHRRRALVGGAVLVVVALTATILPTWRLSSQVLAGHGDWYAGEPTWWTMHLGPLAVPIQRAPKVFAGLADLSGALGDAGLSPAAVGVALAALLAPRAWRRTLPWLLASAVALTLPLGPAVWVGHTFVATAYAFVQLIFPPMARCYEQYRLVVGSLLGLLLTGALAFGTLLKRRPVAGWLAGVGLGVLALAARPVGPMPMTRPGGGHAYLVAARRWPGAIIDVPLAASVNDYWFQVYHHQPLLGGPGFNYANTRPAEHAEWCRRNSFLRGLEALAASSDGPLPTYDPRDLATLGEVGFTAIVVHLERSASRAARYRAFLGEDGVRSGSTHLVFPLPSPSAAARSHTTALPDTAVGSPSTDLRNRPIVRDLGRASSRPMAATPASADLRSPE